MFNSCKTIYVQYTAIYCTVHLNVKNTLLKITPNPGPIKISTPGPAPAPAKNATPAGVDSCTPALAHLCTRGVRTAPVLFQLKISTPGPAPVPAEKR